MFLRGAGATLALPLLQSLLPRVARAQSRPPVRYIQLFSPFGPSELSYWGTTMSAALTSAGANVHHRRLTDIPGAISLMFGTEFQPFKSKMSLIRGLDVLARNSNHNFCMSTCASSYREGLDGEHYPPFSGQPSVDGVLSASSKTYGANVSASRRLVMLNPVTTDQYTRTRSASFLPTSSGSIAMAAPLKQTSAFLDSFASGFGSENAANANEDRLMNAVWDDYRSVRDGSRISQEDRQRLDSYMGLISDISSGASSCEMPDQDDETTEELKIDNQFRLLAAAMSCGLTRVASILLGMNGTYNDLHAQHHVYLVLDRNNRASTLKDGFQRNGRRVARLLSILDGTQDGAGTLLDNAIVYYSQQYGTQIQNVTTSQHLPADMPVMLAGGGGGALSQGRYIDLRAPAVRTEAGVLQQRLGVPLNNLLVTIMNAMGLSSSDYEVAGRTGYGDYPDSVTPSARRADAEFWLSTEGRRSPLPLLYSGPARG